jgi:hypothetical protein
VLEEKTVTQTLTPRCGDARKALVALITYFRVLLICSIIPWRLCTFDSTSSASYSVWPTCTGNGLLKRANSGMRVGVVMPPVGSGAVAESGLV